jgi:hypothetical protein
MTCCVQVLSLSSKQFNLMLGNLSQLKSVWRLEALRKVGASRGSLYVSVCIVWRGFSTLVISAKLKK